VPNDAGHCGAACTACAGDPHGAATCDGTTCGLTCDAGYYDGGTACAACDVVDHCGPSCEVCPDHANADPTCAGTCGYACHGGYYDTGTGCAACDVAGHCGPSCVACTGATPQCGGARCVCTAASCGAGATPICDPASGACRACRAHAECPSGACDPSGACVAEAEVIYLGVTGCADGGTGTAAQPFCTFPKALTTALAGPRWRIVVRAGTYSFTGAQLIADKQVSIIGADAAATILVNAQPAPGQPVLQIQGAADVSLDGITVSGLGTHGILCNGLASTATLKIARAHLGANPGQGVNASYCAVTITQSTLSGNTGGGISLAQSSYTVENCLIVGNGKSDPGGSQIGGVFISAPGATASFVNNTVADNGIKGGATAGGVWCVGGGTVLNSIVWGNAVAQQKDCTLTYADIQGGGNGTGVIADPPGFVGQSDGGVGGYDYHLAAGSACIDKGTPAGAPALDLDGTPRTGSPDLGCYEAP
jgi:hypothetical protein